MAKQFDIYVRISQEGDRTEQELEEQLALYESKCIEWAGRNKIEAGEFERETNVSGSTAVEDRKLDRLIARVESGESAGILTPYLDRFGRDQLEGCLAWKRIKDAGGRLVCTEDGLDSNAEGSKLMFQLRMAIAEDYLDRVKRQFHDRRVNASARGVYLGGNPPLGYWKDWDDGGRLKLHPKLAPLMVEAFERRGRGETFASIATFLRNAGAEIEVPNPKHPRRRRADEGDTVKPLARVTKSGIRTVLANEAYLGEAERPRQKGEPHEFDRRGKPKTTTTIRRAHEPLVSVAQWEAAQAAGGAVQCRNNGRWSSQVRLAGLVYCENGHRLKTGGGGSVKYRHAIYTCTVENCNKRATVDAARLDDWVENLLTDAAYARVPEIAAILEGDDRYDRALAALADAQAELDAYRAKAKISVVGADAWNRDVQIRTAEVDAARAALKSTPRPQSEQKVIPISEAVWAETAPEDRAKIIGAALDRDANGRFIARVIVSPVGQGTRVHVSERAKVWLVGAEEALDTATVTTVGDPETIEILAAAHAS